MRRSAQQLSDAECIEILKSGKDGVLAVSGDDSYPYAVPLNYIYLNDCIYFHCAKCGHKLDAIKSNSKVSFCVVSENEILQPKFTTLYKSVIVFGRAEIVTDEKEIYSSAYALAEKYCPDFTDHIDSEIQQYRDNLCIVRIRAENITGKQCKELLNK